MQLRLQQISEILAAPPVLPGVSVNGYSIDSRTVRPGELFFAVRGERLDGHHYVRAALEAGAAAAVVEATRRADFPAELQPKLLAVPDTLQALQALAAAVRRLWGGPVVAITGSAGKTTTRQMTAALLATRFRVLQSEGNLNNHFGLPLSLLRLEPQTEVGVFELAMSAPGEIRLLAGLAAPQVGVVTNVSAAHLEFFPNVDAIARAKLELVEQLGPRSWAVLNADDPRVRRFGTALAGRTLYFGISHAAHFQAQRLERNGNGGYSFAISPQPLQGLPPGMAWDGIEKKRKRPAIASDEPATLVRFHLPLLGQHSVLNFLAALAAAYALGIAPGSLREAAAALRPASWRGETLRLSCGALLVNDCYNSNPAALDAMLSAVAGLPARRRLAVLGGMMELGASSETLHRQAGRRARELGFDQLLTVGEAALAIAAGARAAGMPAENLAHFATPQEAGARLRDILREGDAVLLKASRSVHLETVWDSLGPLLASPQEQKFAERH